MSLKYELRSLCAAALFGTTLLPAAGQDTLYFEDFSTYADGTTIGSGTPPAWSRDISGTNFSIFGYFETRSRKLAGYYTRGQAVWMSRRIFVSGYTNLQISGTFFETQQFPDANDVVRAFYLRNADAPVQWANLVANFDSSQASSAIADGDSVEIWVRLNTDDFNGTGIQFDNILLTGELAAPPIADFTANSVLTCDGIVQFTDLSQKNPDMWSWDFGDGGTDSVQNPSHTYASGGTYTVTLIARNGLGTDTIVKVAYITVDPDGGPAAMGCKPATTGYCCGFGITAVSFNTINRASGNASEGYQDYSCSAQTTVTEGKSYTLTVSTGGTQNYNIRAWIDYNNDAAFDPAKETVYSGNDVQNPSATVTIPSGAVRDTVLRLRVSADYAFNAPPGPCSNVEYGQAEDYGVTISENTLPPAADFLAADSFSCTGTVRFSDNSENLPTSWYWEFGDGATSFLKNPVRTYTADGTFLVRLIVSNAYGSDTVERYITVDRSAGPPAASCAPQTLGYCCNYGIYKVTFNTIANATGSAAEGYMDFSCSLNTTVLGGNSYTISVETGPDNPEDVRVWIDYNNDGALDDAELVFSASNAFNPSGTVAIPASGVTGGTPLRMRVLSDFVGSGANACTDLTYGQAEDYGVIIDLSIGAEEKPGDDALRLFPNPATTTVTVPLSRWHPGGPATLVIRDLAGRTVLAMDGVGAGDLTLRVAHLPAGIYHVTASAQGRYATARLVITGR